MSLLPDTFKSYDVCIIPGRASGSMASQPIILDYHQNYFVPCQLRLIQAGTFYQFNFCQCVQRVRTIPCDGTEKLSVGEECAHWDK
jgi:hypothetical protein